jgi:hypothetical protein
MGSASFFLNVILKLDIYIKIINQLKILILASQNELIGRSYLKLNYTIIYLYFSIDYLVFPIACPLIIINLLVDESSSK